jgi:hypothetical protein
VVDPSTGKPRAKSFLCRRYTGRLNEQEQHELENAAMTQDYMRKTRARDYTAGVVAGGLLGLLAASKITALAKHSRYLPGRISGLYSVWVGASLTAKVVQVGRRYLGHLMDKGFFWRGILNQIRQKAGEEEQALLQDCTRNTLFSKLCRQDKEEMTEFLQGASTTPLAEFRLEVIALAKANRLRFLRNKTLYAWHFFDSDGNERTAAQICRVLCNL